MTALKVSGVMATQITVITPFHQQVSTIRHVLMEDGGGITILTVDKSQGHENDCVIASLVLLEGGRGDEKVLGDGRRTNVMLTRARSKLIIVGSGRLMKSNGLEGLFSFVKGRGWVIDGVRDEVGHRDATCC